MNDINFNNIELVISAAHPSQLISSSLPQIAFSGRSNVGKSSLLNTLCGRKALARVSSTPGKTATVNYYNVGGKFFFADLPGYGYAKRSGDEIKRWGQLMESYFASDARRLVLQLIDLKVGATADDESMLNWLAHYRVPFIVVATKCDKLNKTDRQRSVLLLKENPLIPNGVPIIPYSSLTKEGRDEVLSNIKKFLNN